MINNDTIIQIYEAVLNLHINTIRTETDLRILETGFLAGIGCMDIGKDDFMKIANQQIDIRKRMFGDRK